MSIASVLAIAVILQAAPSSPTNLRIVDPTPTEGAETPTVAPADAAAHVGERATVCGTIDDGRYLPNIPGKPTLLSMGKPYPKHHFTAVIVGPSRQSFGAPEVTYLRKRICVRGTVEMNKGTPRIVVRSLSQIVPAQ